MTRKEPEFPKKGDTFDFSAIDLPEGYSSRYVVREVKDGKASLTPLDESEQQEE